MQGADTIYIVYLSENHSEKLKCQKIFVQNIHFSYQIILKFYTEHGSDTAMLYASVTTRVTTVLR